MSTSRRFEVFAIVFATVAPGDAASFAVVDAIAAAVLRGEKPVVTSMAVE